MFGQGALNRLRSLDVYRKIPKDYTESTLSGAMSKIFLFWSLILFSFNNKLSNNGYSFC